MLVYMLESLLVLNCLSSSLLCTSYIMKPKLRLPCCQAGETSTEDSKYDPCCESAPPATRYALDPVSQQTVFGSNYNLSIGADPLLAMPTLKGVASELALHRISLWRREAGSYLALVLSDHACGVGEGIMVYPFPIFGSGISKSH